MVAAPYDGQPTFRPVRVVEKPFRIGMIRRRKHWARTDGRCWYCAADLVDIAGMFMDHVQARSKGGSDDDHNLVPCCPSCNSKKHRASLEEFRQREWNKKYAFSDMQVEYLRTLGVELPPEDERPRYVFAFEREGWE